MRRLGYRKTYALGSVAGSACLGMLIPPSVLLIVWAILTEMSVGALFVAGVVPGILLALLFCAYCVFAAIRNPDIAPHTSELLEEEKTPRALRDEAIGGIGIVALIVLVIGGIWGGIFTPTEAAGFGALGALALGVAKGMRGRDIMQAIFDAGKTTAPIMILLIAASMYSRLLAMGGAVNVISGVFAGLDVAPIILVLMMAGIWLLLGMLIDSVSIILLTVPIFVPIAALAGFHPFAFAIFGILVIEAGLLTPPFALLVYTVKGSVPDPSVRLSEIFAGSVPYWIMILVIAFLVWLLPGLATWMPGLM